MLALLFSRIFLFNPMTQLIGDGWDNYEFMGFMHIARENILNLRHPFSGSTVFRYPEGFDFSYGYDGAFPTISGAFLGIVFNKVLAYNLTVVLILFLNLYISFVFFEKLGQLLKGDSVNKLNYYVAGLIFGFSPYVFARINSHLNLAFVAGFPILTYYIIRAYLKLRVREKMIFRDFWGVGWGLLLVSFGSLQYLLFLLWFVPILLGILWLSMPGFKGFLKSFPSILKDNIRAMAPAVLAVLGVFTFFYWGYLYAVATGRLFLLNVAKKPHKPELLDLVFPNRYLGSWWGSLNPSGASIENVVTLGVVSIVLLVFFLILCKQLWPRILLAVLVPLQILLILGILRFPLIPEGGRFILLISLVFSCLLVGTNFIKSKAIAVLIVVLLLAERLFFMVHVHEPFDLGILRQFVADETNTLVRRDIPDPFKPEVYKIVNEQPGQAVLHIPMSGYNAYYSAVATFYNKALVDGYFHHTADNEAARSLIEHRVVKKFNCDSGHLDNIYTRPENPATAVSFLKSYDVNTIVLYKNDKYFHDACKNVRDWWHWLYPVTIQISEPTDGVVTKSIELVDYEKFRVQLFFTKDANFALTGFLVHPRYVDDVKVTMPDGTTHQFNDVKNLEAGLSTEISSPMTIRAQAGDVVTFESELPLLDTAYFTVFYSLDYVGLSSAKPLFELIYDDDEVEIYNLN